MAKAYEIALICDIKICLPEEALNTLAYMTREQDYAFETSLQHELFSSEFCNGFCHETWRHVISNTSGKTAEEHFFESNQISLFTGNQVCFRRTANELAYLEEIIPLMNWLATISDTFGRELVGFRANLTTVDYDLIYFMEGEVIESYTSNPDKDIPQALRQSINKALGGKGIWT